MNYLFATILLHLDYASLCRKLLLIDCKRRGIVVYDINVYGSQN